MSQLNSMLRVALAALVLSAWSGAPAMAAAPGITGQSAASSFDLSAEASLISQPDGQAVYSWGYGCRKGSATPNFAPAAVSGAACPSMQIPGPTLIVHQGDIVIVKLTNNLPAAAGNTSILFPGFTLLPFVDGSPGLLTQEAAVGQSVTYSFVASTPGTHSYYSGTQGDLQIEMGLFGAIIVLPTLPTAGVPLNPADATVPSGCHAMSANLPDGQTDFRLAAAAYNHVAACYDREYLFQFSEMDPAIHAQAEKQAGMPCVQTAGCMVVATEPYHPAYFMVNGRSMPDDMDSNYAPQYPHQPYNGNPHMHPGELVLLRIIGTGRWQHPFHEHGNHVRLLARDGNLLLAPTIAPADAGTPLAGPLLFTTTTTPGVAMDGIFYWTGRGLNWDVYGHYPLCTKAPTATTPGVPVGCSMTGGIYTDPFFPDYLGKPVVCTPDANGYYTADPHAPNYYEWCQDHNKPLEAHPFGQVGSGGPVTLPDPNIMKNGTWFGGSPYLGPDATVRATAPTGTTPPSGTIGNSPSSEAGFAFMWHSHNEREITTNNMFPGGMMMMMLVDPQAYQINEAN